MPRLRAPAPLLVVLLVASCSQKPAALPAQAAANTLRIVATEYAFGAPDTVSAGLTTIAMVNQGKEVHHAVVMRIDSGKTLADVQTSMMGNGIPSWISFPGGPSGIVPGDSSNNTEVLTPGNYVLICFENSPDGKPHFAHGMIRSLVVRPAGPALPLPNGDVTITTRDYGFDVSPPLTAGTHTVRMVNAGPQLHEVAVFRLLPGKTLTQVKGWLNGGMKGAPPMTPMGGNAGTSVGLLSNFTATFTPGSYILLCSVPDAKDGKPHGMHGMVQLIKVS